MNPGRRSGALLLLATATLLLASGCDASGSGGAMDSGRAGTGTAESTGNASPAAATGAGASESGRSGTPAAGDRARVVVLGTSLTAGLGLSPDQAYPALLQRKADSAGFRVAVVNAGLSGETSAGALRRASWVLDQPAAAVVLEVGANDGLRGVNPDSTYANLVGLIADIRRVQPSARVLLVQMEAPTNLGRDYTTRFHEAYTRAARDGDVPLLPFLLDGVAGDARYNQADGIHPNVEGSRRVADTMWRALSPLFAELSPR